MCNGNYGNYRVKWTGEFRPPKIEEWFLSGSIIEGYKAITEGMTTPYHIGKLVLVEEVKTIKVIEEIQYEEKNEF
jgi:hypothetical protein